MEMTMEQFVKQYAENLYEALKDHGYGVDSINWYCSICPLQAKCQKDSQDNPDDNTTCGGYICRTVTDGKEYRV
ncbi:MAG: hypothetical protein J6J13_03405 [Clostridia bacterium]|nr:hypothetical protein [Clostridia bacterium]